MQVKLKVYNCTAVAVGDGDTFRCSGDVRPVVPDCFDGGWAPKVRVIRVNAAESGEELWAEHRDRLAGWLSNGPFDLLCYGRDKYGRLLADGKRSDLLSEFLLSKGTPRMSEELLRSLVAD